MFHVSVPSGRGLLRVNVDPIRTRKNRFFYSLLKLSDIVTHVIVIIRGKCGQPR